MTVVMHHLGVFESICPYLARLDTFKGNSCMLPFSSAGCKADHIEMDSGNSPGSTSGHC
jgi:hypothetical protein